MPLPRVRFTVRRMMVAVAVIAIPLWGYHLAQLSDQYFMKSRNHWFALSRCIERGRNELDCPLAAYERRIAEKYEYAARYPWLPVAPDPPEPE